MNIDIKKISKTPKDQFEAIDFMIEFSSKLLDAILIMNSAVKFNTENYKEINEKRMIDFIKQFEKTDQ
tara:strand:- start:10975 stop:11178 length:204 start_codon:yes stop_codon:yes gene_type:complete